MSTITNTSRAATPPHVAAHNHSPQAKPASSPWNHIVRGESELITATPSHLPSVMSVSAAEVVTAVSVCSDEEGAENGNVGKKPVWNKPVNGASDSGQVMDGSWPALGESARSSAKSSSDSLKGLSDGTSSPLAVSVSQGAGTASTSVQKQFNTSTNSNPTPNSTVPMRTRSTKRNVPNTSANGSTSQPSGLQGPGEVNINGSSSRDHVQRSSQSRGTADQLQQRNSFRNRNGGSHGRGDGSYAGRRDPDRGNQDWNSHRNFNGRDSHMPNQRFMPRNVRHPHPTPSQYYQPAPVVRPYGAPIFYADYIRPPLYIMPAATVTDSMGGVPYAPLQYPQYIPPDLELRAEILRQIEYYFSFANLVKDTFLRQNMDDQGWVPIKLIAGFKKVSQLTDNVQLILDVLRNSDKVEVQDDKVRTREEWIRWILPPSVQFPNVSGPQFTENSVVDKLAANVQNISLNSLSH